MRVNEEEYLQSGKLERYALGLLQPAEAAVIEKLAEVSPVIRAELDRITETLQEYIVEKGIKPKPGLKNRVMSALSQLVENAPFDLNALPLIDAHSSVDQWQRTLASIQPPDTYRNIHMHCLRQDLSINQFLLWVRYAIKPEQHHDEQESFLILEGSCECSIGGELVRLSAGDYLAVPLDLEHAVQVTSATPVKAIVQRLKIAL